MMRITHKAADGFQEAMLELTRCGFQPFGGTTQGSGNKGRALSADGMTWAELVQLRSGLSGSLRQLLGKGVLRGTGCTAQFTSEFTNGDCLVTTTAPLEAAPGMDLEVLPPGTPAETVALHHMQRIEASLLRRHPLKLRIHTCATDVTGADERLRRRQALAGAAPAALNPAALHRLGVPQHLAQMIAGRCADAAELPQ